MSIIQLKEANCKNCYKCIRHCDVKSITFHDDQAHIREDERRAEGLLHDRPG